jgi:hypothetical protein
MERSNTSCIYTPRKLSGTEGAADKVCHGSLLIRNPGNRYETGKTPLRNLQFDCDVWVPEVWQTVVCGNFVRWIKTITRFNSLKAVKAD